VYSHGHHSAPGRVLPRMTVSCGSRCILVQWGVALAVSYSVLPALGSVLGPMLLLFDAKVKRES
jgi:hypothetical protein